MMKVASVEIFSTRLLNSGYSAVAKLLSGSNETSVAFSVALT
jgi:hypothetical protein